MDFSINGLSTFQFTEIKVNNCELIDFGDNNIVNSSNFNTTILKFSEKLDHPFLQVLISDNRYPESNDFVAVTVTMSNNFVSLH